MGKEVIKFLEKNKGKWFSTGELTKVKGTSKAAPLLSRIYNTQWREIYGLERKESKIMGKSRTTLTYLWRINGD